MPVSDGPIEASDRWILGRLDWLMTLVLWGAKMIDVEAVTCLVKLIDVRHSVFYGSYSCQVVDALALSLVTTWCGNEKNLSGQVNHNNNNHLTLIKIEE